MTKTLKLGHSVVKLAARAVRYKFLQWSGLPAPVEALSLEITHRCIARCIMCNIWKRSKAHGDIPLDQWLGLLSSPILRSLRELDVTGGEPFLRGDLENLLLTVTAMKKDYFPSLRTIAITTNGFLTDRVRHVIGEVIASLDKQGIDLVLAFAMDGVGEIHNKIRRVRHGWDRLNKTIEAVGKLRETYPSLVMGIKTTILPLNIKELEGIARYAKNHALFTIISPCIITENRYGNTDLARDLQFTRGQRKEMETFFSGPHFRWSCHRDVVLQHLQEGFVEKPCSAGFNYFFVRSTGEIFPCPLIDYAIGDFTKGPFDEAVRGRRARQFRKVVGRYPACRSCTEPGLERYALPCEGLHYLRLLFRMGPKRFAELHAHMGLNKYL